MVGPIVEFQRNRRLLLLNRDERTSFGIQSLDASRHDGDAEACGYFRDHRLHGLWLARDFGSEFFLMTSVYYLVEQSGRFISVEQDERFCLELREPQAFGFGKGAFSRNTTLAVSFMNMQLAAASLDLGTMWVSAFRNPKVDSRTKELLNIPSYMRLFEMMAIGHPKINPGRKKMRSLDDVLHFNRADNYRTDKDLKAWF